MTSPCPVTRVECGTITVSGYQPVAATVAFSNGRKLYAAAGAQPMIHAVRTQEAKPSRCVRCLTLTSAEEAGDMTLGFNGLCAKCLAGLVATCHRRNKRLPHGREFFCQWCERILDLDAMVRPDPDGRQRRKCQTCRHGETKAADDRRRARMRGLALH